MYDAFDYEMIRCIRQKGISLKLTGHDTDRSHNQRPEDLSRAIAETVSAIIEITGKSTRTTLRMISLLKLFDEIQTAIRQGTLPVSQGYLFAANPLCPDRGAGSGSLTG